MFTVFIGVGKTSDEFDVFIPLSFCSISELNSKELILNKLVEVYRDFHTEDQEELEEMDEDDYDDGEVEMYPFFEAATRINLYEVIQSVLYEVCFYKTDKERLEMRRNQNNEQMNKNKINILEVQLAKHIYEEEYEKASVAKRELDRLKALVGVGK